MALSFIHWRPVSFKTGIKRVLPPLGELLGFALTMTKSPGTMSPGEQIAICVPSNAVSDTQ
jgi:hypothetical protein